MECEKIFANHLSVKGLVSKVYEKLLELSNKKANNAIEKFTNYLNGHFFFQKKYSDGPQIHEVLNINNYQKNANQNYKNGCYKKKSVSKNLEKKELFCTVGVNVNWFSHYRKQYGGSLENLN